MRRTGLIVYVHVGEGRLDVEPGGDRGRRFHLDPSAPDAGTVDVGEAFDIEIDEVFEPALEERGPKLAGTDALLHADGESSAALRLEIRIGDDRLGEYVPAGQLVAFRKVRAYRHTGGPEHWDARPRGWGH